jgi:putative hydrolase of the HAD superfamily
MDYCTYTHFIFDLDNTLYNENDYLFPVYRKIAEFSSKNYNVSETEVCQYLINNYLEKGRFNLFDNLISDFFLPKESLNHYLLHLRTIELESKLSLNQNVERFIKINKSYKNKFYILTNGNSIQQRNKFNQLEFSDVNVFEKVVYAGDYSYQKPDLRLFYDLGLTDKNKIQTLMIGDSIVDEEFALNVGIDFLNVLKL